MTFQESNVIRLNPAAVRAGQRLPARDSPTAEAALLRRRVKALELALARLSEATMTLRSGAQALREENRELRRELEARRR